MPTEARYVPAAGRGWLTRLYDPALALTMCERRWRPVLLAAVLAHPRPAAVLDLGCASGSFCMRLAEADPAVRLHGVDGDQQMIARARHRTSRFGERIHISQALAAALPVQDATIDVVHASLFLHHLDPAEKLAALAEARRVLRPNGRLVIADWGAAHDPLMRAAFFSLQMLDGFANTRDHAAGRLPSLIAAAGFRNVEVLQRWRAVWGSLEAITAEPAAQS
jgi:ubiquinone/menaquinone biosynthesis C-methylase UbiE